MSLKHQFLAAGFYPLKLINVVRRIRPSSRQNGRLRVLLYHDIAPWHERQFAAQLSWLSRSWQFISPDEFAAIVTCKREIQKDSLLLTFDDGFISNRHVTEKILNPMGIKALFFIVSGFVEMSSAKDWRSFIADNIYPSLSLDDIPPHWQNMTWDDLGYLLRSGHSIGAHTATHACLSQVADNDLEKEIVNSADRLEKMLSYKIRHFAYTFGDLASYSPSAHAVAQSRFDFIYTGLRGVNTWGTDPTAIRRDAIAATDSLGKVGALLEGGADFMYRDALKRYQSWSSLDSDDG